MDHYVIMFASAAALLAAPEGAAPAAHAMPSWLTGVWAQQAESGEWVEEWWTSPRGRMMIGASKTGTGDTVNFFEHMRIEGRPDGLAFCALPKGQAGACFAATAVEERRIVFENPKHDFPTRVTYWREGDELFAEVSGPGGSNPQRWRYRKAN